MHKIFDYFEVLYQISILIKKIKQTLLTLFVLTRNLYWKILYCFMDCSWI